VFVTELLKMLPSRQDATVDVRDLPRPPQFHLEASGSGKIRPEVLMQAIQLVAIDRHDCLVMAESGNSFTWATHYLRFSKPGRYRVSTGVGSMGHFTTGVVGAAIAGQTTAIAIAGDGAMLMLNEINTAVKFGAPAVWVVLNDARYNMCEQGMSALGLEADARIPPVDFSKFAQSLGASGEVVESETDLDEALERAIAARRPFVLDVRVDPARPAPAMARNRGLRAQGIGKPPGEQDISFPRRH
jgi:acetolactate synthase-1/2/3 large subunit